MNVIVVQYMVFVGYLACDDADKLPQGIPVCSALRERRIIDVYLRQ